MLKYNILSKLHKIIILLICYEPLYVNNTEKQQIHQQQQSNKQDTPTHTVHTWPIPSSVNSFSGTGEVQVATHHYGFLYVPAVVTHGTPHSCDIDLHPALVRALASSQPHVTGL